MSSRWAVLSEDISRLDLEGAVLSESFSNEDFRNLQAIAFKLHKLIPPEMKNTRNALVKTLQSAVAARSSYTRRLIPGSDFAKKALELDGLLGRISDALREVESFLQRKQMIRHLQGEAEGDAEAGGVEGLVQPEKQVSGRKSLGDVLTPDDKKALGRDVTSAFQPGFFDRLIGKKVLGMRPDDFYADILALPLDGIKKVFTSVDFDQIVGSADKPIQDDRLQTLGKIATGSAEKTEVPPAEADTAEKTPPPTEPSPEAAPAAPSASSPEAPSEKSEPQYAVGEVPDDLKPEPKAAPSPESEVGSKLSSANVGKKTARKVMTVLPDIIAAYAESEAAGDKAVAKLGQGIIPSPQLLLTVKKVLRSYFKKKLAAKAAEALSHAPLPMLMEAYVCHRDGKQSRLDEIVQMAQSAQDEEIIGRWRHLAGITDDKVTD